MTIEAPLALHRASVQPEWIDYNNHMNVAFYVLAFDAATEAFLEYFGLTAAYRKESGCSTFAVEAHITYQRELKLGDPLKFTTQLLGSDEKRVHYFHAMYHAEEDYLAATIEQLSLHVDLNQRRVTAMPAFMSARLATIVTAHRPLGLPKEAGRVIGDLGAASDAK